MQGGHKQIKKQFCGRLYRPNVNAEIIKCLLQLSPILHLRLAAAYHRAQNRATLMQTATSAERAMRSMFFIHLAHQVQLQ